MSDDLKSILDKARLRPEEHKDAAKESVLRATGRPTDPPPKPARTAADILAGDEAFKKFLQMRDGI